MSEWNDFFASPIGDGGAGGVGLPFKGALVRNVSTLTANFTTPTAISWDQEIYDTDDFHDNVTNNSRLTVPAGVTRIQLQGNVQVTNILSDQLALLRLSKNGSSTFDGFSGTRQQIATTNVYLNVTSSVLEVVEGDYFELEFTLNSDTSVGIVNTLSSFSINIIEGIAPSTTPRGALVKKAVNEITANYSAGVMVPWTAEEYDTDVIHDNSTNNTRLTVPSGVTQVRLSFNLQVSSHTVDQYIRAFIAKNGTATLFPGTGSALVEAGLTEVWLNATSQMLDVVAGDYFELWLRTEADTSINVLAVGSSFAMEIVEPALLSSSDPAQILQTLADGANISWNHNTSRTAQVTLAGNRTLDNPTNSIEGLEYTIKVIQDGTGSRILTYDTAYKFASGTAPTLSTGINDIDVLRFWFDGTDYINIGFVANIS